MVFDKSLTQNFINLHTNVKQLMSQYEEVY